MSKDFEPFWTFGSRTIWSKKGISKICQNTNCINGNLKVCGTCSVLYMRARYKEADQGNDRLVKDWVFKKTSCSSSPRGLGILVMR